MQKQSEEISVEHQNVFTKFVFGKSFKAWVSLIEKHYVDKKSKHLKKNIIFKCFEFFLRNFVNFFPKNLQLKNFCET